VSRGWRASRAFGRSPRWACCSRTATERPTATELSSMPLSCIAYCSAADCFWLCSSRSVATCCSGPSCDGITPAPDPLTWGATRATGYCASPLYITLPLSSCSWCASTVAARSSGGGSDCSPRACPRARWAPSTDSCGRWWSRCSSTSCCPWAPRSWPTWHQAIGDEPRRSSPLSACGGACPPHARLCRGDRQPCLALLVARQLRLLRRRPAARTRALRVADESPDVATRSAGTHRCVGWWPPPCCG